MTISTALIASNADRKPETRPTRQRWSVEQRQEHRKIPDRLTTVLTLAAHPRIFRQIGNHNN